jgi:uncharacterized protein (TIGR03435 family)
LTRLETDGQPPEPSNPALASAVATRRAKVSTVRRAGDTGAIRVDAVQFGISAQITDGAFCNLRYRREFGVAAQAIVNGGGDEAGRSREERAGITVFVSAFPTAVEPEDGGSGLAEAVAGKEDVHQERSAAAGAIGDVREGGHDDRNKMAARTVHVLNGEEGFMIPRVLAVSGLMILLSGVAVSQSGSELAMVPLVVPADKLPEFDVADIQVSKTGGRPNAQFLPGGRVELRSLPMKFMILAAWGFENDEGRVTGGPTWMNSEAFDIVAKAPHESSIASLRLMLRSALIKRFGLESHIEEKVMPVYVLTKGKGDLKMTPSTTQAKVDCKRGLEEGVIKMTCHNMTMDELANGLRSIAPAYFDKPVVNLTELTGAYDFQMSWTPRGLLMGTAGRGGDGGAGGAGGEINVSEQTAGGITAFDSVAKYLGLKLESSKHAMPVIVVDKVNRTPTEN